MSTPSFSTETAPVPHPLRTLTRIAWFLLGALFIFSGLIKLNDPVGTAIKLEEYFEVFAVDFGSFFLYFKGIARTLSIVLSSMEVILGVALLLRWHMRHTLWALLTLLVFFTFLTFYSAAFNKVTDCGCFGDFIKLTPWTSFAKDVFLLVLWAIVFFNQRFLRHAYVQGTQGIMTMTFVSAIAIGIGMRALGHLPYLDFLPYKVGNDIGKLMKPAEPARYRYTMTRNGETKEFDKYPTDSTWQYQAMATLNPEQSRPVITDFEISDVNGNSYTGELLKGNKLVLIVQNTNKTDRDRFEAINALMTAAAKSRKDITALTITSTSPAKFDSFRHDMNLSGPYYFADATVLKSIIRSNPGLVILNNGVVQAKYHYHDIPELFEVEKALAQTFR
ncbi:DoxX family protein [Hymenobacter lapidarius]|uniref:DoxX family protein n=1 Tax=Hymenobacter lapidarius TaxID=1908237 RepID=A0A1G1SXV2_9BACT|nr:BT_3928 family protein [Hymenobacter lapidarius]OGX83434.1 DoxX family protein [Hymenobacter lapidarius]